MFWRARSLSARQWRLLAEAFLTLAGASAAIRLLPFREVARLASDSRARRPSRGGTDAAPELRWAVDAVANRLPWRAVCFQRGLALHAMLRRRGLPSLLHYGVRPPAAGELAAHVWVSLEGETLIGGEAAAGHRCLATFPAAP